MPDRSIIHVDMDEFFAAVEKLDRPELRGQPLLIGGDPKGRGVIATASYEARAFGCRSAMPMSRAIRLCPQAAVLPVRMERYSQLSDQVFAILARFSPVIEPLSIDEAFLDVTGCERLHGEAVQIARSIKSAIAAELGLTASVGVAPNKFLAKLASDLRKPDGLMVITAQGVHQALDGLPITRLWGVGPAGAKQFARLNIQTIGQLRKTPRDVLEAEFGQWADHYLALANGRDDRPVTPDGQAKSIGQEQTFAQDVGELEALRRVLMQQVEEVARRLRRAGLRGRTVTLKIRYGDFTTISRSCSLDEPTDITQEIRQRAEGLLEQWAAKHFKPLRLLGVTVSNLSSGSGGGRQLPLFEDPLRQRQRRLDETLDKISKRLGSDAIRRGLDEQKPEKESSQ